jgi:type IV secretory pathway VirB4 component
MAANIYEHCLNLITTKIQSQTLWEKMNPLLEINKDMILTKNLNYVKVIKLRGKEYSGLDKTKIDELFNVRSELLQMIDEDISVTTHSIREIDIANTDINDSDRYIDKITKEWNNNFKDSYKTYHYIIISNGSKLDYSVMAQLMNKMNNTSKTKVHKVNDVTKKIIAQLNEFEPFVLENEELVSFFASYINGRKIKQKIPTNNSLTNILPGMTLKFPKGKDFMQYQNNTSIYSKWISIQLFDNEKFEEELLEELMSYKAEFTVYQSFQKFQKDKALDDIRKKMNLLKNNSASSASVALDEIDDVRQGIEQNIISVFNYSFAIQVKNKDFDRLVIDVENITNIIDSYGYRANIESENVEPLYWSCLPDYSGYLTNYN